MFYVPCSCLCGSLFWIYKIILMSLESAALVSGKLQNVFIHNALRNLKMDSIKLLFFRKMFCEFHFFFLAIDNNLRSIECSWWAHYCHFLRHQNSTFTFQHSLKLPLTGMCPMRRFIKNCKQSKLLCGLKNAGLGGIYDQPDEETSFVVFDAMSFQTFGIQN